MAAAPPPAEQSAQHLASMFTSLVSSLDTSSRRALGTIVEQCHTRRAASPFGTADLRAQPVLFFRVSDDAALCVAAPHLPPAPPAPPPLAPLEASLVAAMDDATRKTYLVARFYAGRRECAEVGYRYLLHLAHPDRPLAETLRELPGADYDETRHVIAANDDSASEDDEEMAEWSDDEDSFCSDISDVTRESALGPPNYTVTDESAPLDRPRPAQRAVSVNLRW